MRFTVESWDPSYGVGAVEDELNLTEEPVDVGVETAPEQWAPVAVPPAERRIDAVAFVDGVRRIDAQVWIIDGDHAHLGVCATVASGAVMAVAGRAEVIEAALFRGLYTRADGAGPIVTPAATYELVPCAEDTVEARYLAIHQRMTDLELSVSRSLPSCELVVFDGPLRGRTEPNGVGYVKTQHVQYLPAELQPMLGKLGDGERTPVFLIGGRFPRWSWYLRLPGPRNHPLSGVIRCELVGAGTSHDAAQRATAITATLPGFASEPHKDTRAPQNLYPIAGLERDLRRRLGDALFLERALRRAAATN